MFDVPPPRTNHPHESTWDHHGSYQWSYFAEPVKRRISFFLEQRLGGRNLDLGGGWYLSYPNSTVVDLSTVCLDYHPAKEKLQFDLDELASGKQLPYADHTFDSATAISLWQYLEHPAAVLHEMKRVLKPGAEFYIINGQGGALEECARRSGRSEETRRFFREQGLDTLLEHIPCSDGSTREFQSVCVAMPGRDVFGTTPSRIRNKKKRTQEDLAVCQQPSRFTEEYRDWEMRAVSERLCKLATFPVTQHSQEYLARCEAFSRDYQERQGTVLLFMEHQIPPAFLMATSDSEIPFMTMFELDRTLDNRTAESLLDSHGLRVSWYCNYFDQSSRAELMHQAAHTSRLDSSTRERTLRRYAEFLASLPMNFSTSSTQAELYFLLRGSGTGIDERIAAAKAFSLSCAATEFKQRRSIDKLIAAKQRIATEVVPVVRNERLEYRRYLGAIRELID